MTPEEEAMAILMGYRRCGERHFETSRICDSWVSSASGGVSSPSLSDGSMLRKIYGDKQKA